jgi:hypothetical protein
VMQTPVEHGVALGYDRLADLLKSPQKDKVVDQ